jgi:hypothetical protein
VLLAVVYGLVFAIVVGLAERAAGSAGRIVAIVIGIVLSGPYIRWALRR